LPGQGEQNIFRLEQIQLHAGVAESDIALNGEPQNTINVAGSKTSLFNENHADGPAVIERTVRYTKRRLGCYVGLQPGVQETFFHIDMLRART
jgi:hypothetical protein